MDAQVLPAYLRLPAGALRERAAEALDSATVACALATVASLADAWSACKTGPHAWFRAPLLEFREAHHIAADLGVRRLDERWPDPRLRKRLTFG